MRKITIARAILKIWKDLDFSIFSVVKVNTYDTESIEYRVLGFRVYTNHTHTVRG